MNDVWINFVYNPLPILGSVLAFFAAIAFLVFLRGFLSGLMYLFTLNGNDDFMKQGRIRVLWAYLLIFLIFGLWEVLRWIVAVINGTPRPATFGLALTILIALYAVHRAVFYYKKKEEGGH